jgi:hypothetical protein
MQQIHEIGYLVEFESLLSSLGEVLYYSGIFFNCLCCVGDEIGMLEDMCVAVTELATVQFQVWAS